MSAPNAHRANPHWTTTASLQDIADWLRSKRRTVVLTHVKPDGDAIGSTLAIVRAINLAGASQSRSAEAWYFGPQPPFYSAIAKDTPARVLEHQSLPPAGAEEPDAILIVDTGSWSQLEPAAPWLKQRHDRTAIIDHHVQGDADVSARRHLDTTAAAAAQPAAELARIILSKRHLGALPPEVAEPCYLGLGTDTGWFKHSNVTPAVLRTAAELLEAGVNHSELFRLVEQQDSPTRLRLLARALASMELHDNGRICFFTMTRRDFEECNAEQGVASGFADYGQTLESTRVTAVFTESEPADSGNPITKVSLRSKNTPDSVDVNAAAKKLGGGGHVRAAGVRVNLPLSEAKKQILAALRAQ